jgi:carbon monoxide dehydrogenase subunit G
MPGHSITLSRHVDATPDAVWSILTDVPSAASNLSGVTSVEALSDGPYRVGTRWRETRTMFGRQASEEMWVTEVDAPRSTVVEAESAGTHYTTTFTVTPESGGCSLAVRFAGESVSPSRVQKIVWKVLGRFGLRAASKAMRTDLDDIAKAAERSA